MMHGDVVSVIMLVNCTSMFTTSDIKRSTSGSPTYQLSKYLTSILQPLTNASRHKLQSTENFINAIKTIRLPDNYKLVSFDVKSLFTSIPLQLALDCTEALLDSTDTDTTLPMPACEVMVLLKLCLESTFFQFNGKHYKQLHGTAMGSPVSVVVAECHNRNYLQFRIFA